MLPCAPRRCQMAHETITDERASDTLGSLNTAYEHYKRALLAEEAKEQVEAPLKILRAPEGSYKAEVVLVDPDSTMRLVRFQAGKQTFEVPYFSSVPNEMGDRVVIDITMDGSALESVLASKSSRPKISVNRNESAKKANPVLVGSRKLRAGV